MCFGLREREVKKSKAGDGGLHAVGQSSGTAVPWEPRAQIADELYTRTGTVTTLQMWQNTAVHNQQFSCFSSANNSIKWTCSPSMLQCHGFPKSGWERRILHLQMLPGVLEIFEESISAGGRMATWQNKGKYFKIKIYTWCTWFVNLPGDRPSHSLCSIISCKWTRRQADRKILLILISIPRSGTHKFHC